MEPPGYPPALRQNLQNQQTDFTIGDTREVRFRGRRPQDDVWALPSAQQTQGAMLVLPNDIKLYEDVIARWESITINLINQLSWGSNRDKVDYLENLLGESEKKVWIQWRMSYPDDYEAIIAAADEIRNVTSQVRRIVTLEDPFQGSTAEQDRAYNELERLTCNDPKYIIQYMNEYRIVVTVCSWFLRSEYQYMLPWLLVSFLLSDVDTLCAYWLSIRNYTVPQLVLYLPCDAG